ncbi:hypothetical protein BurJ1DRAFT_2023 [Burkholderiales bacterium JOSHI_001]|nr:hypothetical protein BurJ1DRAFT_2023 [Burkholderiales bacterium JOSHI_001]
MAFCGGSEDRNKQAEAAKAQPAGACKDSVVPCPKALTPAVKISPPRCPFLAKGKSVKVKATGTPAGGTYSWSATGGLVIGAGAATDEVTVTGGSTSAALADSTLTVQYTLGGKTASDATSWTVYEISKIEAKLRATPCRRDGTGADSMPARTSVATTPVLDANTTCIVKGCGELNLTAAVVPNTVPVSWSVERAPDDKGDLAGLPALADNGGPLLRKLKANATGSFHVQVFHDCGGKGKPGADDGVIVFSVNIVDVLITENKVIKRDTLFRNNRSNAAALVVDSSSTAGAVPAVNAVYTDAEFTKYPLSVKLTVTLIGGGPKKLRGTDRIRLGFIQTTTADSVTGTYADGRTLKEVIAVNAALASPITGGAPAMLGFPVRDTRGASNTGAGPFIVSSSDVETSELAAGGRQRVVRYVEPPAIALNMAHPVTAKPLTGISGSNDFDFFLCAYSDQFDANYAVAASASWSITYGSYTPAGGWTTAGAAVAAPAAMAVHSPPVRAEDLAVERCAPNFVDNLKMDAR